MEVSGQVHAPAALAPGKESSVEIEKEALWVQSHSERGDDEKLSV
jgi:hypothetical protein